MVATSGFLNLGYTTKVGLQEYMVDLAILHVYKHWLGLGLLKFGPTNGPPKWKAISKFWNYKVSLICMSIIEINVI